LQRILPVRIEETSVRGSNRLRVRQGGIGGNLAYRSR